jgi:hypothetical protein
MYSDNIDEINFVLYAAKHYDNRQCYDTLEFYDDLKRFTYIKRLFTRYEETGDIKERLVLNHIIVLYNVFGQATTRMLFFKLRGYHHILKPFLVLLGYMPDVVKNIGLSNENIYSSDVPMDGNIVELLRKI